MGNTQKKVNEYAFSVPLTPEAEYWIGFIMADGCIVSGHKEYNQKKIQIVLAYTDKEHLEKFKTFLGSDHKIMVKYGVDKQGNKYPRACAISIASDQIVSDLSKYGITKRKSFTAKPSSSLKKSKDFWRGVVDGDGSLFVRVRATKNSYLSPTLSLVGTKEICEGFKEFCLGYYPSKAGVKVSGNIYKYTITGNAASVVVNKLYSEASVSLTRKLEASKSIKEAWIDKRSSL